MSFLWKTVLLILRLTMSKQGSFIEFLKMVENFVYAEFVILHYLIINAFEYEYHCVCKQFTLIYLYLDL